MSRASNLAGFTTSISPPANLSVGIITASSVINVGTGLTLSSGGINITGVITATSFSGNGSGLIGVSAGIGTTGSVNTSGIITATSFFGSGANLTGVSGVSTTGSVNTSGIITATSIVVSAGTTALPSISPTGDSNTGIFFPSADTIAFSEGGAEAMRVDSSGRLLIGISTSGNANGGILQLTSGITFPATAVAASDVNTLDDYEEGTFSAGIAFGGNAVGVVYASQGGAYVKTGRMVWCSLAIQISNKGSSTGNMTITGLPFTSSPVNSYFNVASEGIFSMTGSSGGAGTANVGFYAEMSASSTSVLCSFKTTAANAWTVIQNTDSTNTMNYYLTICYQTST